MTIQISDLVNRIERCKTITDVPGYPVVISSRVRLARNLLDYKFTSNNSDQEKEEIVGLVEKTLAKSDFFKTLTFLRLNKFSELERRLLVERNLISSELATNFDYRAVAVEDDECYTIMVNEEDHLRLQAINNGLALETAYQTIDAVDSELGKELVYGFSSRYGYLTACPTNVGTGLRASVMVHLPGLVMTQQIRKILPAISRLGLAIRGIFGEGTDVMGNLFQISNQITLGKYEEEVVDNITQVAKKLIAYEEETRRLLQEKKDSDLKDNVWRAYGLLKYSRSMKLVEGMELLSNVRLGVDLGIIECVSYPQLQKLLMFLHPAHLLLKSGVKKELSPQKINVMRADFIREELN